MSASDLARGPRQATFRGRNIRPAKARMRRRRPAKAIVAGPTVMPDGMQQLVAVANHLDELLQPGDELQHCQAADRRGE